MSAEVVTERGSRGGGRRRNRRQDTSHDEHLSRLLSLILRHRAIEFGIAIRPDGFVRVDELLGHQRMRRPGPRGAESPAYTLDDLRAVTANNNKQRFTMIECQDEPDGPSHWLIRANQGHSIPVPELELTPIDAAAASDIPVVVHGTYFKQWQMIKTSPGLHRRGRTHVHLASGVPSDSHVISGMRATAEVYVYVDIVRAIHAGLPFFRSANGVILTPGDENGFLSRQFFSRVTDSNGTPLEFDSSPMPSSQAASSQ